MSETSSAATAAPEVELDWSIESEGGSVVLPPSAYVRPRRNHVRRNLEIIILAGPAILLFLMFVIAPVIVALYYSFYKWKGFGPTNADNFVGLDNYKWTLTNPEFWGAVGHNGIIMVLSLVMQGPLAILVALLLNQKMRGRSLIRVLIFVPYVISEAIVGIGMFLMLQDEGALNKLLGLHVGWLSNPKVAMWTLMFILTWKYLGFAIILMLAGLQGIPEELSEAAAVDGATFWQIQWHIMLPLLKPTIKVWGFLSIIGAMQLFDLVYVIWGQYIATTAGVSTMAWFMAANGRLSGQLGRGSAIAIIVFILSLVVAMIYQRWVLNRDTEGALTEKEED
ncbi:MAG: sugar ABC transporter permease [Propionibacteriaceae bacterium]|jgi:ABC-type sugar transport system permease subunit|nr:sugar ABC transporter permease [Propionibacteriaceae bacterium]